MFKCHKCGREYKSKKLCPACNVMVEKSCPYCGNDWDRCDCQFDRRQAHGGHKRKPGVL